MGSSTTTQTPHHRRRRRRQTAAALLLAGTFGVAACSGGDDDAMSPAAVEESATELLSDGEDGGFVATDQAAAESDSDAGGGFDLGIVGRDVIIEMHVVVSSDDVQRTVSSIMAQASSLGGGVASSNVDYGSPDGLGSDRGYAVLVVKVPPESVDSLLAGLDDTGTVQSINQSAQDVTEQLVDLDVRITNARQSVENVREFMDRTENLNELVTLEGELTRRQTELERLEAQKRNLSDRVAFSTITVEVVPTESVPEPADDDDSIGGAFEKGWEAFTEFVYGVGYVLAVLLPFLVLAAIVGGLGWLLIRRRNRRRPTTTTPHTGGLPLPGPTPFAAEPENEPDITADDDGTASPEG